MKQSEDKGIDNCYKIGKTAGRINTATLLVFVIVSSSRKIITTKQL